MRNEIWKMVAESNRIAIGGHVRPDGDCIGSCTALYLYIKKVYPDKEAYIYLENIPEVFQYIKGVKDVITDYHDVSPDLFISLDCSDPERLGEARTIFEKAPKTINIDHHISNLSFATMNHIQPESSSTCEVLFECMEIDQIDYDIAMSLYTGVIHDSGVFRYKNTSRRTMEIGGILIEKGLPFDKIIDESFYEKTYKQNRLLGRCLLESQLFFDGTCIVSHATKEIMDEFNADSSDLDGIINKLRITKGVKVAALLHQVGNEEYKVSLRANDNVDVSKIACYFGGGGHVKAAGCTLHGEFQEQFDHLLDKIKEQMMES